MDQLDPKKFFENIFEAVQDDQKKKRRKTILWSILGGIIIYLISFPCFLHPFWNFTHFFSGPGVCTRFTLEGLSDSDDFDKFLKNRMMAFLGGNGNLPLNTLLQAAGVTLNNGTIQNTQSLSSPTSSYTTYNTATQQFLAGSGISVITNNGGTIINAVLGDNVDLSTEVTGSLPAGQISNTDDVTAASNKVILGGSPLGAVLKPVSIDVNEAALNLANLGGVINLTNQVTGVLPVTNGGTGLSTAGADGTIFTVVAGVPTWVPASAVVVPNDVTAGSTKVTLGGTPTGASLQPFSIDVNEANLSLQNIGGSLLLTQITPGTNGQVLTTVGGVSTWTTPAATTVSNTSTGNDLTTTVNGVTGTAVPIINTNILSLDATNQLVSTVNGIASTALPIFSASTVDNGLSIGADNRIELGGVLHQDTTIDGAAQSYSVIFADPKKFIVADSTSINLNSLASAFFSGEQVSMGVNNASASATLSLITPKVYDATAATGDIPVLQNLGGNIEFASPASILAAATTNTLGSVINTLTSTVNGVVATAPIINTNVLSLDATNQLVSTVNGIASTALPIFTSDTVDNGLSIGADNRIELGGKLHQATNIDQAGYDLTITDGLVGIGTAAPAYTLDIAGMLNQTTTLPSGRTTSVHSGDNVIGAGIQGVGFTSQSAGGDLEYLFAGDATVTGGYADQATIGITNFGTGNNTQYLGGINGGNYFSTIQAQNTNYWVNTQWDQNGIRDAVSDTVTSSETVLRPGEYQVNSAEVTLSQYYNTRDDSGSTTPTNFLYTDTVGRVLSAPTGYLFGALPVNNGLTNNAGTIQLGGTLVQDTVVDGQGYNMQFIKNNLAQFLGQRVDIGQDGNALNGTDYQIAIGNGNTLNTDYNFAFGDGNTLDGSHSVAVGYDNVLSSNNEYIVGYSNKSILGSKDNYIMGESNDFSGANGSHINIFGSYNTGTNTADYVTVLGLDNTIDKSGYSTVVGRMNTISGVNNAYILGENLTAAGDNTVNIGVSDISKISIDADGRLNLRGPLSVTGSDGNAGDILVSQGSGANVAPVWTSPSAVLAGATTNTISFTSATNVLTSTVNGVAATTSINLNIPANGFSIGAPPATVNAPSFFYDPVNLVIYYRDTNGNIQYFWAPKPTNGLTSAGNFQELGGSLTHNTNINQAGFATTFTGAGNFGIGAATPGNKLEITQGTAGNSGLRFTNLNSGSATVTNNSLQLSLNASGDVILTPDAVTANRAWSTTGNAALSAATNFMGTTDAVDVPFRTNNVEKIRLFSLANPSLGMGRATLAGVNGGASSYSGPTIFTGAAGNFSGSTGWDFIMDDDHNATNNQIRFRANGDGASGTIDIMTVDEAGGGRVGIGTTAPSYKLDIFDNSTAFAQTRVQGGGSGGGVLTRLLNDTSQEYIVGVGGSANGTLGSSAFFVRDMTAGANRIVVAPTTGNVGIGNFAASMPTAQLHTTGTVRFQAFGAGTLITDANGNLSVSSDERLKNIEGGFNRGLSALQNITPIAYRWKTSTGYDTENTYYGFSAQNIQTNIPEAVGEDSRGFLTISDRPILATVVNATKELATNADATNATITILNTGLEAQSGSLTTLEQTLADNTAAIESLTENVTSLEDRVAALENTGAVTTASASNDGIFTVAINFMEDVVFEKVVTFKDMILVEGPAVFSDLVQFNDVVVFNKDAAGHATINSGDSSVEVTFEEPYPSAPVVTVTPNEKVDALYYVTNVTENGFTIEMDPSATENVKFSWNAVAVDNVAPAL